RTPPAHRRRKTRPARGAAKLFQRVVHSTEQGITVQAYLYPGGQLIEGPLTAHRAALPHRQLLVAALNTCGTGIGRGLQTTRPWTVPAFALGLLRPERGIRRGFSGRRVGIGTIGVEDGRRAGGIASGSCR